MEPKKYDELSDEAKGVIAVCKAEFGDLFDNDLYGPFLGGVSPYNDDRLATLLELAVDKLIIAIKMPGLAMTVDNFPYSQRSALAAIRLSLTVEIIRHLIRSYVEIPETSRVGAPDVQRRDYLNRWQGILEEYKKQLEDAAKKMLADMYASEAAAGSYLKTLIDYPSIAGTYIPFNTAERPTVTWWW